KRAEFRDAVEVALLTEAMKQNKPVFCICRGMQILNVALGGTLHQDIPKDISSALSHMQQENENLSHRVQLEDGSFLEKLYKQKEITVNSFHHQSIKGLGKGLRITAHASDGIVEAVEHEDLPVIGVQWHPEISYVFDEASQKLFQALKTLKNH
ncbi:MAG: gamma-glutamyl-gamma-aminobutyrate hydrolase family protein, partial [Patescibacteria group bacterium]